jgi:hypothetical protein
MESDLHGSTAAVIDDRDDDHFEFEVQEELSCTNTDFGGADPASPEGEAL